MIKISSRTNMYKRGHTRSTCCPLCSAQSRQCTVWFNEGSNCSLGGMLMLRSAKPAAHMPTVEANSVVTVAE